MGRLNLKNIDMKKQSIILITLICSLVIGVSCSEDSQTPEEAVIEKLAKTWSVNRVTFEGGKIEDRSTEFSEFELTLSKEKRYSATGSPAFGPFWALTDGSWEFLYDVTSSDSNHVVLVRETDGLTISTFIGEDSLILTMAFVDDNRDGNNDGRYIGVTGDWTFELKQK